MVYMVRYGEVSNIECIHTEYMLPLHVCTLPMYIHAGYSICMYVWAVGN